MTKIERGITERRAAERGHGCRQPRSAVQRGRQHIDIAGEAMRKALADEPQLACGHVWLVGAGPSDPSQLTLQALAALIQADVIVHVVIGKIVGHRAKLLLNAAQPCSAHTYP